MATKPLSAPGGAKKNSVMAPVPMPRDMANWSLGFAFTRGLGRMLGGYSQIPDLDIHGKVAAQAAQDLFWQILEEFLCAATFDETGMKWEKEDEKSRSIYILRGLQKGDAQNLWQKVRQALNETKGDSGIIVEEPAIENRNRWVGGEVVVETHLIFWPENALRDSSGRSVHPVRFRSESSPGYMTLLEAHGAHPFFAAGWLWIPCGKVREGFRIGGMPSLLLPSGREALERIATQTLASQEAELRRHLRDPSRMQEEDLQAVQDQLDAISRTRRWLDRVSLCNVGVDVCLCIYEAFHRQRYSWIAEEIVLAGGRKISTHPWRILYLDPAELRLRLDPRRAWGKNWRSTLLQKLEALTTLERQTRSREGRLVDMGDRFLRRVIDGKHGGSGAMPYSEPGRGLVGLLRQAGAIPTDVFFVEVSVDFLARLVPWEKDEQGEIKWGMDAAGAAERAALAEGVRANKARSIKQKIQQKARQRSYFDHSPRLLTLSNLEQWPQTRKNLAYILLQEVTPLKKARRGQQRGSRARTIVIDGRKCVGCNGKYGNGYRVDTWMAKAGHKMCRGGSGSARSLRCYLEDLGFLTQLLGLHLRFKDSKMRTAGVLEALTSYRGNQILSRQVVVLKYIPANLEDRLRDRLAKAGIVALDEDDMPEILVPLAPGAISPACIRVARKQAGWTQEKLADKIGVSRTIIAYWELGRKTVPTNRLEALIDVLKPYLDRVPSCMM